MPVFLTWFLLSSIAVALCSSQVLVYLATLIWPNVKDDTRWLQYGASAVMGALLGAANYRLAVGEGAMLPEMVVGTGSIVFIILRYNYDYNKKKRMQEEQERLQAACTTAIHANSTKDEFLAVMSHELRTPLTAVMGFTELLADELVGPINEEQMEMLHRIDMSTKHLLCLIEQVLDVSMAQRGQLEAKYTRVDAKDIFSRTIAIMETLARQKGLALYINAPAGMMVADTDLAKLRQVIVNLVGNAIKFTNEGSVTVELRANAMWLTISVKDTGIGIPAEVQGKIFEPFWRGEQGYTRNKEGAGLGLAITRDIVKLLRGTIQVKSEEGQGTEFTVRMPRYKELELPEGFTMNGSKINTDEVEKVA